MSDAKSRYEIVNELTEKKTSILDSITALKTKVEDNRAVIEQTKRNQIREMQNLERDNSNLIEDLEAGHKLLESNTATNIAELTKKVDAYNDAIESIKAISGGIEKQKE